MQMDNVALDSRSAFGFSMGSLTPAATASASTVEQEFTVPAGTPALKTTDQCYVTGPGSGNKVGLAGARVSTPSKIKIAFVNPTAGSLTHGAGEFRVFIVRA